MFKQDVKSIADLINIYLRKEGLETPLLQKTPYRCVGEVS